MADRRRSRQRGHRLVTSASVGLADETIEARIGRRVQVQADGCWLYRGESERYGRHRDARADVNVAVHRFVYETLVGPIPDGHHLHHDCETPGCCNPAHLTPLKPKEHKRRHPK